jgi:hypothetical protein
VPLCFARPFLRLVGRDSRSVVVMRPRTIGSAVIVASLIFVGCSSGSPSETEGRVPTEAELESVLAATAHQRVFVDNSFGGGTAFTVVHVVERLRVAGESGMVDNFAPGGRALSAGEKDAIARALNSITVEWVPNIEAVIGTGSLPTFRERKAVLTLAVPRFVDARAEATSQLWCGPTCGIGSTHVLSPAANGDWKVTGTTGTGFIS